jgi:hypothetical protein
MRVMGCTAADAEDAAKRGRLLGVSWSAADAGRLVFRFGSIV